MNADLSGPPSRNHPAVKPLLLPLLLVALLPACARQGSIMEGGVLTFRSSCPSIGLPAGTGDITLFDPPGRSDAAAIDVSAAITNLRSTCQEGGAEIISTATFDVVGVRRVPGPARQVVLPYFDAVVQSGDQIVAKRVGYVALNFAEGAIRAASRAQAIARVNRSATALPAEVERNLRRQRRPGDADAAIDPLSDPATREAVARATFEHLVGFQLNEQQLRYNVTR
jgi:hypothetical protein